MDTVQEPTESGKLQRFNRVSAFSFMVAMAVGIWQLGCAILDTEWNLIPLSVQEFREGKTFSSLEKQWDSKMPLRPAAITWTSIVKFAGMGGTGDQVVGGSEGWLFLTDEVRYYDHRNLHLQQRITWIKAVADRLEQDNVTLIVAPIPDKARLYATRLGGKGPYPSYNQSRYGDFIQGLRAVGIHVSDVGHALGRQIGPDDLYYRTDTHWNQLGASIAARAIASSMADLGVVGNVDAFRTTLASDKVPRTGDLIRLMGLADAPIGLRPTDDMEAPATTVSAQEAATVNLLGDIEVPVTLVGTSFSLRGNFHGYLQQTLGLPVFNAAKDGSGFIQSMAQYVKGETYTTAKPRAIVWELPERFLYAPLEGDEKWFFELDFAKRKSE